MNSKILVESVSSIVSPTAACTSNLRHYSKMWNNFMVQVVLGGGLFHAVVAHVLVNVVGNW